MNELEQARDLASEQGYHIHQLRVSAPGTTGLRRKQDEDDYVLQPIVDGALPTISFDTLPELVAYLKRLPAT